MIHFEAAESGIRLALGLFKVSLFSKGVCKNSAIFLPAGDVISYEPLFFGRYEYCLTSFFKYLSDLGYSDCFIDIGSNIGLSVIDITDKYEVIHCFEPNPVCFLILRANLFNYSKKIIFHDFGIGSVSSVATLSVPKNNVGGGGVFDQANFLSDEEISNKDRFDTYDEDNYTRYSIDIRSGDESLVPILTSLSDDAKIVFKVDVEGYEINVLEQISKYLGENQQAVIVFENFSRSITRATIKKIFVREIDLLKLQSNTERSTSSKLLKLIKVLIMGRKYSLMPADDDLTGQIVVMVK